LIRSLIEKVFGRHHRNIDALLAEYRGDAAAIEEAPLPIGAALTIYAAIALVVAAVLWAIIGKVDRVILAQGKIITQVPTVIVQPLTTGRIKQMHVRTGDIVSAGQLLVSLDEVFASADRFAQDSRVKSLASEELRLMSEAGRNTTTRTYGDDGLQSQIRVRRAQEYAGTLEKIKRDVASIAAAIQQNAAAKTGAEQQLKVARDVVELRQDLYARQYGSKLNMLAAQAEQQRLETLIYTLAADRQKLVEEMRGRQAELVAFKSGWQRETSEKLVAVNREKTDVAGQLKKTERLEELTELRAAVDGTVLAIAERSIGSVVREAETLLRIVPLNSDLLLEGTIRADDRAYITNGTPVRIKLAAYNFQRFGTLRGTLVQVSPDSFIPDGESAVPVYRIEVRIDDSAIDLQKRGVRLTPGLFAHAEIKSGRRSIMSYLLDPLTSATDEALKEP
jgi:hemolysin D